MNGLSPSQGALHPLFPLPLARAGENETLGNGSTIGSLVRDTGGQQEIDRNAKRACDLLMECYGANALASFEVGEITLGDPDGCRQLNLGHLAPFAQDSYDVLTSGKPIDMNLGKRDLMACGQCGARSAHDPGNTGILAGSQCREPLVIALSQNGEFLPASDLNELNLRHDGLSSVYLTAVSDGGDHNSIPLDIVDDPPITNPQSHPLTPLEALPRKRHKLRIEASPHIAGETEPLPGSGSRENDLHNVNIAKSDGYRNQIITHCNIKTCP